MKWVVEKAGSLVGNGSVVCCVTITVAPPNPIGFALRSTDRGFLNSAPCCDRNLNETRPFHFG
jgi:hypothetical protein